MHVILYILQWGMLKKDSWGGVKKRSVLAGILRTQTTNTQSIHIMELFPTGEKAVPVPEIEPGTF